MKTEILIPSLKNSSICIHDISTIKTKTSYDWHIHNECEMLMLFEGSKTFWVSEKKYILSAGDIIFVNENIPHKTKTAANSRDFLMQMRHEFHSDTVNNHLYRYINHASDASAIFRSGTEENTQIRHCIENILKENSEKNKSYDMFIKSEVLKIFAILYRYNIVADPLSYFNAKNMERILPVLDYVDTHYAEPVSLNQMCKLLNVDKAHFCRIFKKAVNTSFVQYLNFVRVLKAEKLLLSTDKSIAQISEETGFSSPAYFAKTFKLNMSCSPSYYKNIKLTKNNQY